MSNPTIERLIELKFNNTDRIKLILKKGLDELNLIITTKINKKIKRFIHNLIYLKIIIEDRKNTQYIKNKKKKKENVARKTLKEFKLQKQKT